MTYAMVYVCMQQFIVVFAFLMRSNINAKQQFVVVFAFYMGINVCLRVYVYVHTAGRGV